MKLALFFTRGISLEYWLESGLFDREKLLYEEHLKQHTFSEILWFTYGVRDGLIADQLYEQGRLNKNIRVIGMPRLFKSKMSIVAYSILLPLIRFNFIRRTDILKTNQINGSWSAVLAKWLHRKPLVLRSGYTLSFVLQHGKIARFKKKCVEYVERFAYRFANVAIVSSEHDKAYLIKKYVLPDKKINVVTNYIDIHKFRPLAHRTYPDRIIFVGRLSPEKNLFNLIEAVSKCNVTLDVYGKGESQLPLQNRAKELAANVNFRGVVPNSKLPEVFNCYQYYILPSLYEGMPKSLLEAMACGLVCIGTNVDGINEVIKDNVNGYLCGTDNESIRDAILKALNAENNEMICQNARDTVLTHYRLKSICEKEAVICHSLK